MASRRTCSSQPKESCCDAKKMQPDCFSPELFTKMAKKIAQLTKVVYTLNTRVEDQEALMQAMKELHEESLQKITTDAKEKIALCQTQVSRQVSLLEQVGELEGALEQERKERCRLEGELVRHRAAGSSVSHQLLALYGQARDAGLALRRKLDQFERFQLQIALALEDGASSCGLPVASLTPDESRALIESGGEWNGRLDAPVDGDDDCFLRKNDFLREQCDQLVEENARIRSYFEGKVAGLKSFYEDSLSKLQSSRKLELANDFSVACCDKSDESAKNCAKLDLSFRRKVDALLLQLSDSEEAVDRYSKEIKTLCEQLEKREKHLKVLEDQVFCSKEEQQKLATRLKQSDAALSQLKSSCTQHKQELISKTDKISMLEATKSEQEAYVYRLQADLDSLKHKVQELTVVKEDYGRLQSRLRDQEAAMAKLQTELQMDISSKAHKVQDLELRLQTSKEESKYLKLIQTQLKESLLQSEHKCQELTKRLEECTESLSVKDSRTRILCEDVKRLKWELKEAIEEREALLADAQRKFDLKAFESKKELEEQIKNAVAKESLELSRKFDKERENTARSAIQEKEAALQALAHSWAEKYDNLSNQLSNMRMELDKAHEKVEANNEAEKKEWNLRRKALEQELQSLTSQHQSAIKKLSEDHARDKRVALQNLKDQHKRELDSQAATYSEISAKLRQQSEAQLKEQRAKLVQDKDTQLERLHLQVTKDTEIMKAQLGHSHSQEIHKVRKDLDNALQELRGKGQVPSSNTGKKHLDEQTEEANKLRKALESLQGHCDSVSKELESKKNEVLRVRSEATQQIKNLELYWQRRITKELKDNSAQYEREKAAIQDKWSRNLDLLKDKIASLESMLNVQERQKSGSKYLHRNKSIQACDEKSRGEDSISGYDSETTHSRLRSSTKMISYTTSALCSPRLLKRAAMDYTAKSSLPRRPSLPGPVTSRAVRANPTCRLPETTEPLSSSPPVGPRPGATTSPGTPRQLRTPEGNDVRSCQSSRCNNRAATTPEEQRKRSVWFLESCQPGPSTEVGTRRVKTTKDSGGDDGRTSTYSIPKMIGDTFRKIKSYKKDDTTAEVDAKRHTSKFYGSLSRRTSPRFSRLNSCDTIRESDDAADKPWAP